MGEGIKRVEFNRILPAESERKATLTDRNRPSVSGGGGVLWRGEGRGIESEPPCLQLQVWRASSSEQRANYLG